MTLPPATVQKSASCAAIPLRTPPCRHPSAPGFREPHPALRLSSPSPSRILRACVTCCAFDLRQLAGPNPERFLQANPHIAAHRGSDGGDAHLVCTRAKHRPVVIVAEQPVRSAPHLQHVFGMRADAAENAEHRLHEDRRLDDTAIKEMLQGIQMADVVALDLEAGVVPRRRW